MPPYVLHNRLGSGGFVIEAGLTLAGIDFDYDPLPSQADTPVKPLIGHLNPWGQIPVLVTPTGDVLTEVAAMVLWLGQKEAMCRAGPHIRIDNETAFYRWTVFLAVNVYEGILRQSYPERYAYTGSSDPNVQKPIEHAVQRAAHMRVHSALKTIEQACVNKPFLLGHHMSLCDIFLAMLYAWHNKQPDLPKCTQITKHVATHPIIAPIWHRNFSHRLDENWQKG